MAIFYWMVKNRLNVSPTLNIYCVEPSLPMRLTAQCILPPFINNLKSSIIPTMEPLPFTWRFAEGITNLEECASADGRHFFDLALFCHTFAKEDLKRADEIKNQVWDVVSKHLKKSGVLVFLTPNSPIEKVQLMDQIEAHLVQKGMKPYSWKSEPSSRRWCAPTDRQNLILQVRRKINTECQRFGLPAAFDDTNPQKHHPYYRFSCQIHAFEFPKEDEPSTINCELSATRSRPAGH